jgi:glucose-1-phosphate thymidylyltransferase
VWGIIPAAGAGTRIQTLAFSKELLPVGSRFDGMVERPRAVSEHLLERMLAAGATKIVFVISPGKSDILEYFGGEIGGARICYLVQRRPAGLCDAIFQAVPFIGRDEEAIVGLPDTLWFPVDGLAALPHAGLSFLLFPVDRPDLFDAVSTDDDGAVREIEVKKADAQSKWIWGAFKLTGAVLHELHDLWCRRDPPDEYFGTLVNAYLALGGRAIGVRAGDSYVDVGTLHGYREATLLLERRRASAAALAAAAPLL